MICKSTSARAFLFVAAALLAAPCVRAEESEGRELFQAIQSADDGSLGPAHLMRGWLLSRLAADRTIRTEELAEAEQRLARLNESQLRALVREHDRAARLRAAEAPRLLSREFIPNAPAKPAVLKLENRHTEPLFVQVVGTVAGGAPEEIEIAPGKSVERQYARNSGGVMEETILVGLPTGEFVEQVVRTDVPGVAEPCKFVVYENRIQSAVYDRTKKVRSDKPDEVVRALRSIGVFSAVGTQDATLDMYDLAARQRNPGAAGPYFQELIRSGKAAKTEVPQGQTPAVGAPKSSDGPPPVPRPPADPRFRPRGAPARP